MKIIYLLLILNLFACASKTKNPTVISIEDNFRWQQSILEQECLSGEKARCPKLIRTLYFLEGANKAIEYSSKQCRLGKPVFCYSQALVEYAEGDVDSSLKKFETLCNQGEEYSCYFLGSRQVRQTFKTSKIGNHYLRNGCLSGDVKSCVLEFSLKPDKEKDIREFHRIQQLILASKNKESSLGIAHTYSLKPEQRKKSFKLHCEAGDIDSCFYMNWSDNQKEKESKEAISQNYCDKGSKFACNFARWFEYEKRNLEASKVYAEKACLKNELDSCLTLANYDFEKKDYFNAEFIYRIGCIEADIKSCYGLGYLNDRKNEFEEAKKYYRVACDLGSIPGCLRLSYLEGKAKRVEESAKYALMACELGNGVACYTYGIKLHKEKKQNARKYFSKSCDTSSSHGCFGMCLLEAEDKNLLESKKNYIKACKLSSDKDCREFRDKKAEDLPFSTDEMKQKCHYDPDKPWWFWPTVIGLSALAGQAVQ